MADRKRVAAVVETRPEGRLADAAVLARIEVPAGSGWLRLSPKGERFAVALPGRGGARRFLTGTLDGDRVEIPAMDLQFVDDDHVLVVAPADAAYLVRHIDLRAPGTSLWQVPVTRLPDPYVQYAQDEKWAIAGSNASQAFVGAFGRLGDARVEYRRWRPDRAAQGAGFSVWMLSPERALEVVTVPTAIARTPWGPLFYWRSGQSMQSRVWLLHGDMQQHLATWPGQISCTTPPQAAMKVICVGWRAWEGGVVVWRLSADSIGAPLAVPGEAWRWGVSHDARLFAMHARDVVTVVDLEQKRVLQRRVEPESGSTLAVVPTMNRLAMLRGTPQKRVLVVYEPR
jgi:hypothetical protein